jgi:hypothetical protein
LGTASVPSQLLASGAADAVVCDRLCRGPFGTAWIGRSAVAVARSDGGMFMIVSDDPQEIAESLDEDVVDDVDDTTGDEYGDGLPDYPPDRPLGVDAVGVTAVEEDAGESFAQRTSHGVPEVAIAGDSSGHVGQLVEPDASTLDDEEELIADEAPGEGTSSEESAMHLQRDH